MITIVLSFSVETVSCRDRIKVVREVVVTGIGLISALGDLDSTWQRLLSGQSAIQPHQLFPELSAYPLAVIGHSPANVMALSAQVATAAIAHAKLELPLPHCGVVLGSSRSQQARWEGWAGARWQNSPTNQTRPTQNSPTDQNSLTSKDSSSDSDASDLTNWLQSLPHMPAIALAQQIGATGPVLAPMAACATGLWAIARGCELIQAGVCDRVIAGAVEAPISPLTLAGFSRMGALAQTGAYPFDRRRDGLVLGEGAAVLVLEAEALAKQRQAKVYGRVLGAGFTADGYHVSAPSPHQQEAIAAVKHCLARSDRSPAEIDYIHAHGTATQLNDRNEAHLIQSLFPEGVAVSSTKGATGHTLGASGALGAAFCLMALHFQQLPPNVGLRRPEFELNLVHQSRLATVRNALCFSFGFGGQNVVMAFGRA